MTDLRISILLIVGFILVILNMFPSFAIKIFIKPFWGAMAGIGFILTGIFYIYLPELIMISIILGPVSTLILINAFLAKVLDGHAR